jgi:hypothetical protein
MAKARADAAPILSSAFPKGDARRVRGHHGTCKLQCGVEPRIITRDHRCLNSRFQLSPPAQLTDDPVADLLEDLGNGGSTGGLDFDKAGLEVRCGTIEGSALTEEDEKRSGCPAACGGGE